MPAATRTIAQIIDELAGFPESEVAEALTNTDASPIKAFRSKLFAGAKREVKKEFKSVEDENAALKEQIEELNGKLESAPDIKKVEEALKTKHQKEIDKLASENATLKVKIKDKGAAGALGDFTTFLSGNPEDFMEEFKGLGLGGVNTDYTTLVLTAKYKDRIVLDDDGNIIDVLKPGEQSGYDAPTTRAKLALLAADVRKTVPATFIPSSVATGPGLRPQGGTPTITAPEQQAAQEQREKKAATGAYNL
jgi:hypothetical protein